MKTLLVTGSSGLIGSEVCTYFAWRGWKIHGVDNNQRAVFFGANGDTRINRQRLQETLGDRFVHHEIDVRDRQAIIDLLATHPMDGIVHAAGQPSHDLAAKIPFDDFETNATGTLNLLEAARRSCPMAPFVFMSTNKVYGDRPNFIPLKELETRWEYADPDNYAGINEQLSIDHCTHSIFGASKLAADVLVQEYGRYFQMPTCILRGGCLSGPNHAGVELHGFLSYLVKCNVLGIEYKIYGYKGKQVRDNIHSYDVAAFIERFIDSPGIAEVFNLGGGRTNSCSILEAFSLAESFSGSPQKFSYVDQNRIGDHICYISDLAKAKARFPGWGLTVSLSDMISEMVGALKTRTTH